MKERIFTHKSYPVHPEEYPAPKGIHKASNYHLSQNNTAPTQNKQTCMFVLRTMNANLC